MSLEATKARRRAVTYGKASRRIIRDYDQPNQDSYPPPQEESDSRPTKTKHEKKEDANGIPHSVSSARILKTTDSIPESQPLKRPIANVTRKISIKNSTKKSREYEHPAKDAIFDIPISDDEQQTKQTAEPRKRRKVAEGGYAGSKSTTKARDVAATTKKHPIKRSGTSFNSADRSGYSFIKNDNKTSYVPSTKRLESITGSPAPITSVPPTIKSKERNNVPRSRVLRTRTTDTHKDRVYLSRISPGLKSSLQSDLPRTEDNIKSSGPIRTTKYGLSSPVEGNDRKESMLFNRETSISSEDLDEVALIPESSHLSPQTPSVQERLEDSIHSNSPSQINLQKLNLSSGSQSSDPPNQGLAGPRASALSSSPPGPRSRKRVIDALHKYHVESSSTISSSDDDTDNTDENDVMDTDVVSLAEDHTHANTSSQVSSQSSLRFDFSSQGSSTPSSFAPKITYSRQRSYLSESMTLEELPPLALLDSASSSKPLASRGIDAVLTSFSKPAKPSLDEDDEDGIKGGGLKSIYELRQAGGNQRFLAAVDTLFEDIEDNGPKALSRRRNALLDLCLKLVKHDWLQQFLDHGLEQRLFSSLTSESDSITCVLLNSAMLMLLSSGLTLRSLQILQTSGTIPFLTDLLESDEDMAHVSKDRQYRLSKAFQASLADLRSKLLQLKCWGEFQLSELSARAIALQGLELLIRELRGKGDMSHLISESLFIALTDMLTKTMAKDEDAFTVEMILSILESSSLSAEMASCPTSQGLKCLALLSQSLPRIISDENDLPVDVQLLALRLVLNLTNKSPAMCDKFGTSALLGEVFRHVQLLFNNLHLDANEQEIDKVILSLGCLIKFAEMSSTARKQLATPSDTQPSVLQNAIKLFSERLGKTADAQSLKASESNVAFGYLTVFLCNMCLDENTRMGARSLFPGGKLKFMLDAAKEFLEYYKKVDAQVVEADDEHDRQEGFSAGLQETLDILERAE
ncbi:MAG: hypothetical protein M1834_000244 [Cirrosporium novae-zelandiae]|nr:MAG: hypothetical protein M1834_000244 [Cirrosporium novae-zelandiae]